MTPPPAIIFDFGNVIAHFDYNRAGTRLGRSLGLSGQAFVDQARAAGFADVLRDYESGGLTSANFYRRVADLMGLSIDYEEFRKGWVDIFTLNQSIVPVVAELNRRNYRLILGSNTNELHASYFREQFSDVFRHFDALVLSYEVGKIKPDTDFYLACAKAAGRDPSETIFIDDLPENVDGARRAGLMAVIYTDTPALIRDLRSMDVDV